MRKHLGEFEELLLLAIAALDEQAYGVTIIKFIHDKANRNVTAGSVHMVLKRLEQKNYLKSKMGGATKERGGRKKRYFTLTSSGSKILDASMNLKINLYNRSFAL